MRWKKTKDGFELVTGVLHVTGRIIRAKSRTRVIWAYQAFDPRGEALSEWGWNLHEAKLHCERWIRQEINR